MVTMDGESRVRTGGGRQRGESAADCTGIVARNHYCAVAPAAGTRIDMRNLTGLSARLPPPRFAPG